MKSKVITTAAANRIAVAMLGPTWKAKAIRRDIRTDCIQDRAARGLASALRILANPKLVAPGERFTLLSLADQLDADFPA